MLERAASGAIADALASERTVRAIGNRPAQFSLRKLIDNRLHHVAHSSERRHPDTDVLCLLRSALPLHQDGKKAGFDLEKEFNVHILAIHRFAGREDASQIGLDAGIGV